MKNERDVTDVTVVNGDVTVERRDVTLLDVDIKERNRQNGGKSFP